MYQLVFSGFLKHQQYDCHQLCTPQVRPGQYVSGIWNQLEYFQTGSMEDVFPIHHMFPTRRINVCYIDIPTLPETNITPANRPSQ